MEQAKKLYYLLLVAYLIIVTISIVFSSALNDGIPQNVKEAFGKFKSDYIKAPGGLPNLIKLIIVLATLLMGLIGMIGLFFLWDPARYIFLTGIIIKNFFSFLVLGPKISMPLRETFGGIEVFLDGVIIAVIFFSPVREYFKRKAKLS